MQAILRSIRETECMPENEAFKIDTQIGIKVSRPTTPRKARARSPRSAHPISRTASAGVEGMRLRRFSALSSRWIWRQSVHDGTLIVIEPFLGSEAIASGVGRGTGCEAHTPRSTLTSMFPAPTDRMSRAQAALAVAGSGVIAGQMARRCTAPNGSTRQAAELLTTVARRPASTPIDRVAGRRDPATSGMNSRPPARTALDPARRYPVGKAVAPSMRSPARRTKPAVDVELAERYREPRHPKCSYRIDLVDPGAESPVRRGWCLLLIRAGFPRP